MLQTDARAPDLTHAQTRCPAGKGVRRHRRNFRFIGRETALGLAELGATLVLVGRSKSRSEAVLDAIKARSGGGEAAFLAADFSSQTSVRDLAEEIHGRYPRVDALINNAGGVNAERRLTVDGIEETFAVNHLAPFLLTQLLRDRLVASAPGRVVTVSSEAHRMSEDARLR